MFLVLDKLTKEEADHVCARLAEFGIHVSRSERFPSKENVPPANWAVELADYVPQTVQDLVGFFGEGFELARRLGHKIVPEARSEAVGKASGVN